MKKTRSMQKKDTGIAVHIAIGVLLSLICTFLMSVLLTVFVENEIVSLDTVPLFSIGIHILSTLIGSMLSMTLEKGRIAVVAGINTASYLLTLLCINMLIFSSGFDGIGLSILAVLTGGLLSVLIKGIPSRKKKYRVKTRSR